MTSPFRDSKELIVNLSAVAQNIISSVYLNVAEISCTGGVKGLDNQLRRSLSPPAATRPSLSRFSFTQIQIADVLKELQNLDPYKSAGLENLDPLFLKLSAAIVTTPITSLFNLSLISSEIPKDWKAAAVIPLFKGGDNLDPNC